MFLYKYSKYSNSTVCKMHKLQSFNTLLGLASNMNMSFYFRLY